MDFGTWFGKLLVAIHKENIAMLEDLFIYDKYNITLGGTAAHKAITQHCLQSAQWLLEQGDLIGVLQMNGSPCWLSYNRYIISLPFFPNPISYIYTAYQRAGQPKWDINTIFWL